MMKIAYLMPTYPMPSQTFIRREVAALEAGGLTVHRFAARRFAGELTEAADVAEQEQTRCILNAGVWILTGAVIATAAAHPGRWLGALGAAMSLGRRSERGVVWHLIYLAEACLLHRWLTMCGARHLHVHFGTNAASVALLCRRLGGPPFSVTIHGPEEFDAPRQLALREKIHHASFVVAISQFTRSQLYRWAAAADWCKIQVIHCGLDEMFLSAVPTPIPKRPRLVNVGRLSEQKGQLLLIEAAALLHAKKLDFELVIVGDGPLRGELERLIDHYGMRGQVWITGFLDNHGVRRELEAARALVMSSFAEGLPVVIMEALALGRPVISTCIAGIPELVEPGRHGWLVPAGAVEPLAAAMAAALAAETVDLEAMGRAGAARVAEQHNVNNEAKKLAELIADLASIPNARTGDSACTPAMAIPGAVGSPN
jgi:colanic acid/amylovoran biosynthesis glycosyltransferase